MNNSNGLNDLKISSMPMPALDYNGDIVNPDTHSPNSKCGNTCEKLMCASNDAICLCLCRLCDTSIGAYSFNINFNEKITFKTWMIEELFKALNYATQEHTYPHSITDVDMVGTAISNGTFIIQNCHEASFQFNIMNICQDEDDLPKYKKALIQIVDIWMNELSDFAKTLLV